MSNDTMPRLEMIEIYSGNSPDWKGWHNLILKNGEDHHAIAGPIHPETSELLLKAVDSVARHLVDALIEIVQDDRFYRGANWFDKIDEAIAAIQEGEG